MKVEVNKSIIDTKEAKQEVPKIHKSRRKRKKSMIIKHIVD